MTDENDKETTCTFRTSRAVKKELTALAEQLEKYYYKLHWREDENYREAASRSGLIHQLAAGNLTLSQVKQKIENLKEKYGEEGIYERD